MLLTLARHNEEETRRSKEALFLHRIPEGYKKRKQMMMMIYSYFNRAETSAPIPDEAAAEAQIQPPPIPNTDDGLIGGLSTRQWVTLLAAVPVIIFWVYPYLQSCYKKRRRRMRRRDSEGSEKLICYVHINDRRRPKRQKLHERAHMLRRARQMQRFSDWGISVRQLDPRLQIFQFFTEVAAVGASKKLEHCKIHITGGCTHNCLGRKDHTKRSSKKLSSLLTPTRKRHNAGLSINQMLLADMCFDTASVFTVWRPTSLDAIRKMMRGEAVGKGLDIKGKSAIKGKLSALVPVLQIHESHHKSMLRYIPKDARTRLYFQSQKAFNIAKLQLERVLKEMIDGYKEAARIIKTQAIVERMLGGRAQKLPAKVWKQALNRKYKWEMDNPYLENLNHMRPSRYGLEMPQRLFVEAYIFQGDCYREPNSENDTGRKSIPSFQDMNLETLRKPQKAPAKSKNGDQMEPAPRPVVYQSNTDPMKAMDPKDLVMAYEENGRVLPVVSDFDCFLVGTRRVTYKHATPLAQVAMMSWCVDNIEKVLDEAAASGSDRPRSWTMDWLEILKKERLQKDFRPTIPKYGYADPKSYAIMGHAVHHLQANGCVRHGAECFNYYFPQDLDKEFLIVSYDIRDGGNRWRKFGQAELLDFLSNKVDEGFMFPLNPKWILCDPGWKMLYDKQVQSNNPSVQQSVNAWYPPSSGIRDRIEAVHAKHPEGFVQQQRFLRKGTLLPGELSTDQALMELEHVEKFQKARRVFQAVMAVNKFRRALSDFKDKQHMQVRGASLGRGSLPPRREDVIRVRVPLEAIPGKAGVSVRRNRSFTMASLTQATLPLLRQLSFDFGTSGSSLFHRSKPNAEAAEQKPSQRNSTPSSNSQQSENATSLTTRNSIAGSKSPGRPVPVKQLRRKRSERNRLDVAVRAAQESSKAI